MLEPRPPIRIMTRQLAELQTAIIARGLPLTEGSLDRFAILSLIVRATAGAPGGNGRGISVMSLASSMSAPYETVRRHVARLVASGVCERRAGGVAMAGDPRAQAMLAPVLANTHEALVQFVTELGRHGVPLPAARPAPDYVPAAGIAAAADIMLAVLDGNSEQHREWLELVVFSALLSGNMAGVQADAALARCHADETRDVPADLIRPVRAAALARRLGLPETTVRRQLAAMIRDGRVLRERAGYRVRQEWLNEPRNVAVSRNSYANVRRILERLAGQGFAFDGQS